MANKVNNNSGKLLHCNFCEKSQHEVSHLIAGPFVYICGECVELCINIINENKIKDIAPLNKSSPRKTKKTKDKNKVGEKSQ